MLMSFIGSFKCNYRDGVLSLPEPFHQEGIILSYHCSHIGDTVWMQLHQLMTYADGTTEIPECAVTITGGKVAIPVCDHKLFGDEEILEATGYGQGVGIRRPRKGLSGWCTVPDGYITLAGIGKEACHIVNRASRANTPLDYSSVDRTQRLRLFNRLLVGFDNSKQSSRTSDIHRVSLGSGFAGNESNPFIALEYAKPFMNEVEVALRHTGLLILVACVGDGNITLILPHIQALVAKKGITAITIAIIPRAGDYRAELNAGMALQELSLRNDGNATIMIPSQAIVDERLLIPKPYDSFERDCFEYELTDALVAAVEYAVSSVILPFCHAERMCRQGTDFRKVLLQNRLMGFSLQVFRGENKTDECGHEITRLAKRYSCCHVAAFGSKSLSRKERENLSEHVALYDHVSFHYGEWPAAGSSLLVIFQKEVDRDAVYDEQMVSRWAASYWQKVKRVL